MLNKSKSLIKRLLSSSCSFKPIIHPPFKYRQLLSFSSPKTLPLFQALSNSPFSSVKSPHQNNKYKENIALLECYTEEQQTYITQLFDKYTASQNLQSFSSEEIQYIVAVLQHISEVYLLKGDISQSSSYLSEAEEICKELNIKDTIGVANGHFMRGSLYSTEFEEFGEAEKHLFEAERICKKLVDGDDKQVRILKAQISFSQAYLYLKTNKNKKALKYFQQCLEEVDGTLENTKEAWFLAIPHMFLGACEQVGLLYILNEDYKKAEEYLSKSLKIATEYFGEYSEKTLSSLTHLAECCYINRKYQESFDYTTKSFQIASAIFTQDIVEITWCYFRLGHLYMQNNQFEKALESFEEAIKRYEKSPQKYCMFLGDLYYQVSNLFYLKGKRQEASTFLVKSNEMLAISKLNHHPKAIEIYLVRAEELKNLRRWDESVDYLKKALELFQDSEQSLNKLADVHFLLGEVSYGKEDWETALQHFKEAENLLQQCLTEPFKLYSLHSYLGVLYTINKDYESGINYLEQAGGYCEKAGDIGFLLNIYYFLGRIYERRGMQNEREETKKKIRKHRDSPKREDPDVQASLKISSNIFWIIDSLDKANLL